MVNAKRRVSTKEDLLTAVEHKLRKAELKLQMLTEKADDIENRTT